MIAYSIPLPDIDSLHAMQLYNLYLSNENMATAKARDLLVAAGWLEYEEPIANANELQSAEVKPERKPVVPGNKLLVIYPNPASNYLIADYTLPEANSGAKLFISNTSGIVLLEVPVTLNRDQVTIPLQNLSNGNYILTLKTNNKVIETVGFNVMK